MKKIVEETIGTLKAWREAYFSGEEPPNRICYDQLNNIRVGKHECYASYLFNQLSEEDKEEVRNNLDFDIDFDNLTATYYP